MKPFKAILIVIIIIAKKHHIQNKTLDDKRAHKIFAHSIQRSLLTMAYASYIHTYINSQHIYNTIHAQHRLILVRSLRCSARCLVKPVLRDSKTRPR